MGCYTTIFCDLDDTLYPSSTGLWQAIKERMNLYMHERLSIPWEDIPRLREEYFREYGTTLRGLKAHYAVDEEDFLAFVHQLPLEQYLRPAPEICQVLRSLPQRKWILTNADTAHAQRVLRVLQLEDCFEGIIDILHMRPYCKPQPEAFALALRLVGERQPARCVLIDDLPRTTEAARRFGMFTLLYGVDGPHPAAHGTFTDWTRLPEILGNGHLAQESS
uniref:HAD family hydrolase n=1 Tax=uncultured Chloroflexota bacterium TaxID=166587 RepID=H5SLA6_9CHLR|nr:HAD family hydrolase [uncultured Chloroflexota bacterium]